MFLFVVCRLLFVVGCVPFVACCMFCYSLDVVRCLFFVDIYLVFSLTVCSLLVAVGSLFVVGCRLLVARRLLFVVSCLLLVGCLLACVFA